MTLLVGAFSLTDTPPETALCDALAAALSRHPDDVPLTYRDSRVFLAKVDIDAYRHHALISDNDGVVSMLAGDAILTHHSGDPVSKKERHRTADLTHLHRAWRSHADSEPWSLARGTFAAMQYHQERGTLRLVTDALGVRPLYVVKQEGVVIVASALRILEAAIPLTMDLGGIVEELLYGYPLADRTAYAGVRCLNPAEILDITVDGERRQQWFDWEAITPLDPVPDSYPEQIHAAFLAAVGRRAGEDRMARAFLSGGLDSRCIVTALSALKIAVRTHTFAWENSLDRLLSAQYADALGIDHQGRSSPEGLTGEEIPMLVRTLLDTEPEEQPAPDRPNLIWSGDGGSVGCGHVYLTPEIVEASRRNDLPGIITGWRKRHPASLPRKAFTDPFWQRIASWPEQGLLRTLTEISPRSNDRRFYLFLLFNDQRRHLTYHHEHIDRVRLEFLLPFFDPDFLRLWAALPMDAALGHRYYHRWLDCFPSVIKEIPWQDYSFAGHLPCPLPLPEEGRLQWAQGDASRDRAFRRKDLEKAARLMAMKPFPTSLFRKNRLRIAQVLTRWGIRDYRYLFRMTDTISRYWQRCEGRMEGPE
ncbi:MAG: hypothetical protein HQL50_12545 [Magnetococcales bacterium]|nr:hypothetical protein [Magnetococcales bacterium]